MSSKPKPITRIDFDIVVVGSLNVDLIARVARLPAPGETIPAVSLAQRFGGKGANQAVAAARQGADVGMVGCLGSDAEGAAYLAQLEHGENISTVGICQTSGAPTGRAFISVDDRGENQIVVVPGANARLTAHGVRKRAAMIHRSRCLLLQLEVPLSAALEAMRIANGAGVPIVFNPSPWRKDFPWGKVALDTVIVNETEAGAILPRAACSRRDAGARASTLAKLKTARVVLTRGARSTICITAETVLEVPALPVRPVDTVGAGDTFAGALAARLAAQSEWQEAVAWANCAGALATLKSGAQEAIPTREATRRARARLRWP